MADRFISTPKNKQLSSLLFKMCCIQQEIDAIEAGTIVFNETTDTNGFQNGDILTSQGDQLVGVSPSTFLNTDGSVSSTGLQLFGSGIVITGGRFSQAYGGNVNSAHDLTLGTDGNSFSVLGTTQINGIDDTGWNQGDIVILKFTAALTVKNGESVSVPIRKLLLSGSVDLNATENTILVLYYDTNQWQEISRKVP